MLYVPPISDYKPFYIQFASGQALNILDEFKVIVKTHDYPSALKPKEPYNNKWYDQSGDDEYIPSTGLFVEAFTFKLECVMFAKNPNGESNAIADLQAGLRAFRDALLGGGFFKTYDAWTGFGFRQVRLAEFPAPAGDAYDSWANCTRLIFTVSLKVNDPETHMTLLGNNIVEG